MSKETTDIMKEATERAEERVREVLEDIARVRAECVGAKEGHAVALARMGELARDRDAIQGKLVALERLRSSEVDSMQLLLDDMRRERDALAGAKQGGEAARCRYGPFARPFVL